MSEWEPIETAPKDGPIDLWIRTVSKKTGKIKSQRRVIDAFYQIMPHHGWRWAIQDTHYCPDPFDVTTEYTDDREEVVTHWMRVEGPK